MTLSLHGPYKLGYTCATMDLAKSYKNASWSESLSIFGVRIIFCNLKI